MTNTTEVYIHLIWAIRNGDLDAVKEYVQNKTIEVNQLINGRTPLHHAADFGHCKVIQFLLANGANVNATDIHGITPLLAAIWEGHTECVKLLLDKGASRTGVTPEGKSYYSAAEKADIKSLLT